MVGVSSVFHVKKSKRKKCSAQTKGTTGSGNPGIISNVCRGKSYQNHAPIFAAVSQRRTEHPTNHPHTPNPNPQPHTNNPKNKPNPPPNPPPPPPPPTPPQPTRKTTAIPFSKQKTGKGETDLKGIRMAVLGTSPRKN